MEDGQTYPIDELLLSHPIDTVRHNDILNVLSLLMTTFFLLLGNEKLYSPNNQNCYPNRAALGYQIFKMLMLRHALGVFTIEIFAEGYFSRWTAGFAAMRNNNPHSAIANK